MKLFFVLLFLGGCSFNNNISKVILLNKTGITIDSAEINVNNYQLKTSKLNNGDSTMVFFNLDSMINKHDVVYSFKLYSSDKVILNNNIFLNDLGYIPNITRFKITDSLTIERY